MSRGDVTYIPARGRWEVSAGRRQALALACQSHVPKIRYHSESDAVRAYYMLHLSVHRTEPPGREGLLPEAERMRIIQLPLEEVLCEAREFSASRQASARPRAGTKNGKFRGVFKDNDSYVYRARACVNGKMIHLGSFTNAEDAARARDAFAIQRWGRAAILNFPEEHMLATSDPCPSSSVGVPEAAPQNDAGKAPADTAVGSGEEPAAKCRRKSKTAAPAAVMQPAAAAHACPGEPSVGCAAGAEADEREPEHMQQREFVAAVADFVAAVAHARAACPPMRVASGPLLAADMAGGSKDSSSMHVNICATDSDAVLTDAGPQALPSEPAPTMQRPAGPSSAQHSVQAAGSSRLDTTLCSHERAQGLPHAQHAPEAQHAQHVQHAGGSSGAAPPPQSVPAPAAHMPRREHERHLDLGSPVARERHGDPPQSLPGGEGGYPFAGRGAMGGAGAARESGAIHGVVGKEFGALPRPATSNGICAENMHDRTKVSAVERGVWVVVDQKADSGGLGLAVDAQCDASAPHGVRSMAGFKSDWAATAAGHAVHAAAGRVQAVGGGVGAAAAAAAEPRRLVVAGAPGAAVAGASVAAAAAHIVAAADAMAAEVERMRVAAECAAVLARAIQGLVAEGAAAHVVLAHQAAMDAAAANMVSLYNSTGAGRGGVAGLSVGEGSRGATDAHTAGNLNAKPSGHVYEV